MSRKEKLRAQFPFRCRVCDKTIKAGKRCTYACGVPVHRRHFRRLQKQQAPGE